jgi:hypothetical protein
MASTVVANDPVQKVGSAPEGIDAFAFKAGRWRSATQHMPRNTVLAITAIAIKVHANVYRTGGR